MVGSANSSNSVRLVEVALEAGARAAYLVDDAERDRRGLARRACSTVGVTSGASVPETWSTACSPSSPSAAIADVQAVHTAEESLIFALPPELRRDLREAATAKAD